MNIVLQNKVYREINYHGFSWLCVIFNAQRNFFPGRNIFLVAC